MVGSSTTRVISVPYSAQAELELSTRGFHGDVHFLSLQPYGSVVFFVTGPDGDVFVQ